jgi:hypothetical protein
MGVEGVGPETELNSNCRGAQHLAVSGVAAEPTGCWLTPPSHTSLYSALLSGEELSLHFIASPPTTESGIIVLA